ncbi:MAG: hypothetical protein WCP69_04745 [Bacteroidota bacterium]|jgi:hypothetical protein
MNKLRTDTFVMGLILGILLPLIAFGLFYLIGLGLDSASGKEGVLKPQTLGLISIFTNLFTLRYYLIKLKFDRTGRGILMMTFILTLTYFGFFL